MAETSLGYQISQIIQYKDLSQKQNITTHRKKKNPKQRHPVNKAFLKIKI